MCATSAASCGYFLQLETKRGQLNAELPHAIELLADETGIVVPQRDPAALTVALRRVLSEPGLAEQHFGEWQGLTYGELEESRAGDFHRFWHAPAHETPPGGETYPGNR